MTAMEQAELVLGAQEMELDRFLQMFRMLLGCYQVGSIPANLDEVLVSGLDGMRALQAGYLIVLGADEGALPAFSQSEGLLSDSDRRNLSSLGVQDCRCLLRTGSNGSLAGRSWRCRARESVCGFCPAVNSHLT